MNGVSDDGLVARMRGQIVEYRTEQQTLAATVDALRWAFSIGSARLRRIELALDEPLIFLEAVVASGGDHSTAVEKALREIDAALLRVMEQHAA